MLTAALLALAAMQAAPAAPVAPAAPSTVTPAPPPAVQPRGVNAAPELLQAINGGCRALVSGDVRIGRARDRRRADAFLAAGGVTAGISAETLARTGEGADEITTGDVVGERTVGEDRILLANGGATPLCRAVLVSNDARQGNIDALIDAITAGGEWTRHEGIVAMGRNVKRQHFIHRTRGGDVILLALVVGSLPDSEIRTLAMVMPAPDNLTLPEGF